MRKTRRKQQKLMKPMERSLPGFSLAAISPALRPWAPWSERQPPKEFGAEKESKDPGGPEGGVGG